MDSWETTLEAALPGLAVYNVHDSPTPVVVSNRATMSLPGNLILRDVHCAFSSDMVTTIMANDIIPRGTKFGPMVGDILRPEEAGCRDKKYFWRVYDKSAGCIAFYIDGKDTDRAHGCDHRALDQPGRQAAGGGWRAPGVVLVPAARRGGVVATSFEVTTSASPLCGPISSRFPFRSNCCERM